MYGKIGKDLTNLLKRLSDYQIPAKTKVSKNAKGGNSELPNCNNFTSITAVERKKLAEKIAALNEADYRYVIEICFRNKRSKERDDEGVYDVDLEKLDAKVLKELSNFVNMRVKKCKKDVVKGKEEQKQAEKMKNNEVEVEEQAEM